MNNQSQEIAKGYEVRTETRQRVDLSIPYADEAEARQAYHATPKKTGFFVSLLAVMESGSIISLAHK